MLEGWRTHILAGLAMIMTLVHSLGWISQDELTTILEILAAGATMSMRSALTRVQEKTNVVSEQVAEVPGAVARRNPGIK